MSQDFSDPIRFCPDELARFLDAHDGRPTALDAFGGEGGMGEGLRRAGFRVFTVDNDPARLKLNPAPGVVADALDFTYKWGHLFTLRHGSPPCTGYSRGTAAIPDRLHRYDRLIAMFREVCLEIGGPYVIENVEDAKTELDAPIMLCWTMFNRPGSVTDEDGTPLWMRRHRLFESNLPLMSAGGCAHPLRMQCAGAYGGARRDKHEARNIRHGGYVPSLPIMRQLLGTDWMSEKGCQLSIPPDYGQYVGEQVLDLIGVTA